MLRGSGSITSIDGTGTFLVASTPITAHTLNATRVVQGLIDAGHRVLWYAGRQFASHIARSGATAVPFSRAEDFSGGGFERFVASGARDGLPVIRELYRDVLVRQSRAQLRDIEECLMRGPIDAVISDTLMLGAGLAAERCQVPWATIGDGPLLWNDPDTPPFGTGLRPMAGAPGRHRNLTVNRAIDRWLFRDAHTAFNALRGELGLPPNGSLQSAGVSPHLHMQGCSPSFEYPRSNLPNHISFIGALGPGPGYAPPVPTRLLRGNRTRPLAFVTQGTLRRNLDELAVPAARALADDGFDVLVAAGSGIRDGLDTMRVADSRVVVVDTVDYHAALLEADLFVTNGGYTGVTLALAAGVPVLQAGATEEKPDIGARLEWAGVGVSLRRTRHTAAPLRRAARRLMDSTARVDASKRLAHEMSHYDATRLGADLVAQLAGVLER